MGKSQNNNFDSIDLTVTDRKQSPHLHPVKQSRVKKITLWVLVTLLAIILVVCAAAYGWYNNQLAAVDANSTNDVAVEVPEGSTIDSIGRLLADQGLIKSSFVFKLYTSINNIEPKSGRYHLAQSQTVAQISEELQKGGGRLTQMVTFLPGGLLSDARAVLKKAGYEDQEIDAGIQAAAQHPLLRSKPKDADIEGYIYGQTHEIDENTTVEALLTRIFDEMYAYVQKNNLEALYKKQGLTLHEGITLASMIQKEVHNQEDMAKVAQVFLKRLKDKEILGSDVTFVYGARKLGVAPSPDIDSPYNTRKVAGLPPGPIANPGAEALDAVAHPAATDYLYFVAGDDGKTYFSKTLQEHESLTAKYCHKNCEMPQ